MYDVITIPIIVQLTQELDSICGQIPIYALRLFIFVVAVFSVLWIIRCLSNNCFVYEQISVKESSVIELTKKTASCAQGKII